MISKVPPPSTQKPTSFNETVAIVKSDVATIEKRVEKVEAINRSLVRTVGWLCLGQVASIVLIALRLKPTRRQHRK